MRKNVLLIAALIAPSLAFAQDGPRPISLAEAVELARRNAPGMVSARGQLRTTDATRTQAKWAFGPNLSSSLGASTSGGGNYLNGQLVSRASPGYSFSQGLSSSLSLWDGGTKLRNLKVADANIDAAEANENLQSYNIAQQVKTQYYAILLAKENEAAGQTQLAQAQQQLQAARARVDAGTATISDTLQSVISVGNAQLAILNAQNSMNNANAQLTRLTGSPFTVTAIMSDLADPSRLELNDAELFALVENGPSVRSSTAALSVAKANEKGSYATYWPSLNLSGSYSRTNRDKDFDFGQGPMDYSWSSSLGVSFPIWNQYSRESGVISARVSAENADANLREARLVAKQNLTQQLGSLRTAEAQIAIQRSSVASAEENLRVQQARYELGVGTLLELLTAQNTINSARASLISARFTARNARAQIEALIGRELPQ